MLSVWGKKTSTLLFSAPQHVIANQRAAPHVMHRTQKGGFKILRVIVWFYMFDHYLPFLSILSLRPCATLISVGGSGGCVQG